MASGNLFKLMTAFRERHPASTVRHAAAWIYWTDGGLDALLSDQPTLEGTPHDVAAAMKLCQDAGIDISAREIWADAPRIAAALPKGELRQWLSPGGA